ncbi:MAG: VIT domain-containing protein, partial [Pirellulaceae bacterium]
RAGVVIVDQVATTTLDIDLRNRTGSRLEAELVVPVPSDAVVRGFDFQGRAEEPTAELLPREEARRAYDAIVAQTRDPALLEFIGYNLIRSSVFPVEARGTQRVRLTYESVLPADGHRIDYVLPRSESLEYEVPWEVTVAIRSRRGIATVYSPSHPLESTADPRRDARTVRVPPRAQTEPGAFRLSYLVRGDDVTASLLAYPDSSGGGYFLVLAGIPPACASHAEEQDAPRLLRELTLVIDRSGSMNGDKLHQAREAARQIISGLRDGEAFNIVAYSDDVECLAPRPLVKSRRTEAIAHRFLDALRPRGGTNIHDALLEALRPAPHVDMLPLCLFLTDGRPTIGETSERAIRKLATARNPYGRRIFTIGVGVDVHSPLLENLAYQSRGTATFVLPGEDVEEKVAAVFRQLAGPVLADPQLAVLESDGQPALGRVTDLLPARLPDLFDGDQLVLLGRYTSDDPLTFVLSGNFQGRTRKFRFQFDLDHATNRNAFVPRLWAGRKIATLVDAIRSSGADPATVPADSQLRELVDEIVRLSTEFGVLSEYTSFLAREGTDLSRKDAVLLEATQQFRERAIGARTGAAAVNQDVNAAQQKAQSFANLRNASLDAQLQRVAISGVQQIADRAFYCKDDTWIDSRLVDRRHEDRRATREIEFGSPEFMRLARELAAEGRQGSVAFHQDTLLLVDGETVLIRAPRPRPRATPPDTE